MLWVEKVGLCSEIHTKHKRVLWKKYTYIMNLKRGGTYITPLVFKA